MCNEQVAGIHIKYRSSQTFSKNNIPSDIKHGLRSARFTTDVLTIISHRSNEASDGGFLSKPISLEI